MKRFLWQVLFYSSPLLSGCGVAETAPAPPLDSTPRSTTETATFALG